MQSFNILGLKLCQYVMVLSKSSNLASMASEAVEVGLDFEWGKVKMIFQDCV